MGNLDEVEWLSERLHGEPATESQIAFYRGSWEEAETLLAGSLQQARAAHRSKRSHVYSAWLAKVQRTIGRNSEAEAILQSNIDVGIAEQNLLVELHARQELVLLCVDTDRPQMADPHLTRARAVMAAGEDWRGLAGHVARAAGAVAAAEGRLDAANEQFTRAVEIYRRYHVPFEEAEAFHCWGRTLIAAGELGVGLEKLDAATALYRRHRAGQRWLDRVQDDRSHAQGGGVIAGREPHAAAALQPAERLGVASNGDRKAEEEVTGIFRSQGDYWALSWAGSESRLKHRKGFHYIGWLLRHPGQQFAATDLNAAIEHASDGPAPFAANATEVYQAHFSIARGLGDAGAAIDATAKAEYRRRLEDLRHELEQAQQANDLGRAEKARAELEFIQSEISAAMGLGGRDRLRASHRERARLAVTKAIKASLTRIRQVNPELGRHLALSIQTGHFCAYLPREPVTWQL